jgi:hypothetical protein
VIAETTLSGPVEMAEGQSGVIRGNGEVWQFHLADLDDGPAIEPGDAVSFEPDLSNLRQPRARHMRVTGLADVRRACVRCSRPFELSAATQNWFYEKGFPIPRRCSDFRQDRTVEL